MPRTVNGTGQDPCPLPSPGLPHKALSTPELLRSKTVGDPCSAIRRSCSSLAALRCPEHVPPNADGFEELREGDEFFDNFSWLFVLLAVILRYVWHNNVSSFLLIWWILPAMIPEQFMLDEAVGMNVVAAGSGNVNDTRRRPATVAVAVCIGSYARIIFVVVRFRERVLKRSRFKADSLKAGEARGSKKKQHVPGSALEQ